VILVDTSVWVDHLRTGVPELGALLEAGEVLTHPWVVGELACGTLHRRAEILELLRHLPAAPVATHDEVLAFIERHALMGRGLGYCDGHLRGGVRLHGAARLWTRDRRLSGAAAELRAGD
jgi:predicted nucleic acid-binding protein